ncbi:MAG: DUF2330 domain-containing protein [Polyangiales bacterium]
MKLRCVALCVAGALAFAPEDSFACGGCFAPPTSVSVVTDHRMVLSLTAAETILWDQIRYAGSPEEFSWILPIRYSSAVRVEVASDGFVNAVDGLTSPELYTPPCGPTFITLKNTSAGDVEVLREGAVGPFAMSIISGRDPAAIGAWLRDNGYSVPAALAPVIERYTDLSMDFVALRLRPGEGVDRMRPVRIRLPGYVPSLPLRMIAAGAGDRVGLTLVVLAANRVEAQNFSNAEITDDDLTWNWDAPTDPTVDFLRAFDAVNARHGGSAWITETATEVPSLAWRTAARSLDPSTEPGSPVDDMALALGACEPGCFATRLRAVLPRAALDRDLSLYEGSRTVRPPAYVYGRVRGEPSDEACGRVASMASDAGVRRDGGTAPVTRPPADAGPPDERDAGAPVAVSVGATCAASPARAPGAARGALAAVAAALVGGAWRRRRRRA